MHVLASLRTKGFVSEEKYFEQSTELNRKIAKLQKEMKLLTKSDEDDEMLEQISELIDFLKIREIMMTELEEETFLYMIDKIIIKNQIAEFHLSCGLKLMETIH
ncbi:MAG: hypothetical protein K2H89_04510, partial [Oscillospiraceae bacterium]|nr:hypothetical protein [Oscillospiraceae bacterium]